MRELPPGTQGCGEVMQKRTIILAIAALRKMRKKILFDAILHERGWCDTPHSVTCNKLKRNIDEAVLELTEYLEELNNG